MVLVDSTVTPSKTPSKTHARIFPQYTVKVQSKICLRHLVPLFLPSYPQPRSWGLSSCPKGGRMQQHGCYPLLPPLSPLVNRPFILLVSCVAFSFPFSFAFVVRFQSQLRLSRCLCRCSSSSPLFSHSLMSSFSLALSSYSSRHHPFDIIV